MSDAQGSEAGAPTRLSPEAKASLLWGVVGGLAFLVLVQGYELVGDEPVSLGVKFGVAVAVAIGAALLTYVARARFSFGGV